MPSDDVTLTLPRESAEALERLARTSSEGAIAVGALRLREALCAPSGGVTLTLSRREAHALAWAYMEDEGARSAREKVRAALASTPSASGAAAGPPSPDEGATGPGPIPDVPLVEPSPGIYPAPDDWHDRCPRHSDWCDGRICRERLGIDCPHADPPPRKARRLDTLADDPDGEPLTASAEELRAAFREYATPRQPSRPRSEGEPVELTDHTCDYSTVGNECVLCGDPRPTVYWPKPSDGSDVSARERLNEEWGRIRRQQRADDDAAWTEALNEIDRLRAELDRRPPDPTPLTTDWLRGDDAFDVAMGGMGEGPERGLGVVDALAAVADYLDERFEPDELVEKDRLVLDEVYVALDSAGAVRQGDGGQYLSPADRIRGLHCELLAARRERDKVWSERINLLASQRDDAIRERDQARAELSRVEGHCRNSLAMCDEIRRERDDALADRDRWRARAEDPDGTAREWLWRERNEARAVLDSAGIQRSDEWVEGSLVDRVQALCVERDEARTEAMGADRELTEVKEALDSFAPAPPLDASPAERLRQVREALQKAGDSERELINVAQALDAAHVPPEGSISERVRGLASERVSRATYDAQMRENKRLHDELSGYRDGGRVRALEGQVEQLRRERDEAAEERSHARETARLLRGLLDEAREALRQFVEDHHPGDSVYGASSPGRQLYERWLAARGVSPDDLWVVHLDREERAAWEAIAPSSDVLDRARAAAGEGEYDQD